MLRLVTICIYGLYSGYKGLRKQSHTYPATPYSATRQDALVYASSFWALEPGLVFLPRVG